jgi:hypothetical protein
LFSAALGLVVIPGVLGFGVFLIIHGRLILHAAGCAFTIAAWALAAAEIVDSFLSLSGSNVPPTLHVIGTIGGLSAVAWFFALAFWPRLVAKGVRDR